MVDTPCGSPWLIDIDIFLRVKILGMKVSCVAEEHPEVTDEVKMIW